MKRTLRVADMAKLLAIGWSLLGLSAVIVGLLGLGAFIVGLLALGTILGFTRWRRAGRGLMLGATAFVLAVTFLPLDRLALHPLEERFPQLTELPARVNGVIVLGGFAEPMPNGTIGLNEMGENVTTFARLAHAYPQARLVFTGTSPEDPAYMTEGEAVRRTVRDMGIDTSRMTLELRSWNTYQNAVLSYAMVQPQPGETWILVTSASHMPRSMGVFRHVGWNLIPCPTGYKSQMRFQLNLAGHLIHLDLAAHEWLGLVMYRLTGRTNALFPGP